MPRGVPRSGFRMTHKRKLQLQTQPLVASEPEQNRFTINERFEMLNDICKMVARHEQPAMLLVGPGGVGKSFTVVKSLQEAGLTDATYAGDFEIGTRLPPAHKCFRVSKGYATPRGLFKILYDNRDSTLVFDDMDAVLKEPTSISLLKAALDTADKRLITWKSDRMDDEYPNSFEFKGSVVFISNMGLHQMDQAVMTRTMVVDLSMTTQDKVDRIRTIAFLPSFMEEISRECKQDAVEFLQRNKDRVAQLNLRSLIQVVKIRASKAVHNWEKLADFAVCS